MVHENQHMNPDDAVKSHKMLRISQSVGIHFGTFEEHPEQAFDAHEKDLRVALEKYSVKESEFWILKFGEGKKVPKQTFKSRANPLLKRSEG